MLRDIMRVAKVVVPTITDEATVTEEMANLGVPAGEQAAVKGVVLLGVEDASGSSVLLAPAGAKAAISGANVVITEPTVGWATGDKAVVGFVFGHIPESTGTAS